MDDNRIMDGQHTVCFPNFSEDQKKNREFLTKNLESANLTAPNNVPISVLEPFFLIYRETYRFKNENVFYFI